ncbi:MAG: hypothetical protein QNJ00_03405 [Woeseiaceae bacterium]|nr:hypothetical protein [Woeseiaceae bacterium]
MSEETEKRTGSFLREPQMIIALSAIVLSVCGLFVAVYEAALERQAHRASVWPSVEVSASLNPGSVRIWARNTGVGPAQIETAAVIAAGSKRESWALAVESIIGDAVHDVGYYQSMITGRVQAADAEREVIFEIKGDVGSANGDAAEKIRRAINDREFDVALCYCSVYETCWTTRLQALVDRMRGSEPVESAVEVESCASEPRSRI